MGVEILSEEQYQQRLADQPAIEMFAIVEVMGHQRYVGKVTEQVIAGTGFVRIDIPETEFRPAWTKLIGTSAIYAITPIDEATAKSMAPNCDRRQIEPYQISPGERRLSEDPSESGLF